MKIRNLIATAALTLCALAFAPVVQAQQYVPTTALNGGTNNVAATTTNTSFAVVIPVKTGTTVAIQPSFNLTDTGTSAVVLKFGESVDGVLYESGAHSITVTANGTNVVNSVASITVASIGYLRLESIENPNANAITNLTLKYFSKQP